MLNSSMISLRGIFIIALLLTSGESYYPKPQKPCPQSWVRARAFQLCYFNPDDLRDFEGAEEYCDLNGAKLLSISNQRQHDFAKAVLDQRGSPFPTWVDYTLRNGTWKWRNPSTFRPNWVDGQPSNNSEYVAWETGDSDGFTTQESNISSKVMCEQPEAVCPPWEYNYEKGEIKSTNFPDNYTNNLECYYHIKVPYGNFATLDLLDVDLEEEKDFLDIHDGYVWNESNRVARYPTQHIYAPNATLTSPHYPSNYSNNLNYAVYIKAPKDQVIEFQFLDIETEEKFDVLSVWELDDYYGRYKVLATFSGSVRTPVTLRTSQHWAIVRFITDRERTARGFKFSYQFVD